MRAVSESGLWTLHDELVADLISVTDRVGLRAMAPHVKGRVPQVVKVPRPSDKKRESEKVKMTPGELFQYLGATYAPDGAD